EAIARKFQLPLVTGKTPQPEREDIYDHFRRGVLRSIVLSKVGNFALDLPEADVLIQVSGAFGSRQEEAQRFGRILRPKEDGRSRLQPAFKTLPLISPRSSAARRSRCRKTLPQNRGGSNDSRG